LKRRDVLALVPAAFGALAVAGCERRAPTRDEALRELVLDGVVADTDEVNAASERLGRDLWTLEATPSIAALDAARASFRRALLAWRRAACFGAGPLVETSALVRAAFWPVRTVALEQVLSGSGALDDRFVAELGVDLKGLYALEYLLFPPGSAQVAGGLAAAGATRRRRLATLLARSVATHAVRVKHALGDGEAYAERFASGGQASLSQVVERLVMSVEHVASQRFALVLELEKNGMLKPGLVEGAPSGTSQALACTELVAAERLYRGRAGRGLEALAGVTAPAVRARVDERFARALAAARAVGAPLEVAARTSRAALAAAATAAKELELALKVDLTSALGVTITFSATDGD
jgi:predicted lipoprotein